MSIIVGLYTPPPPTEKGLATPLTRRRRGKGGEHEQEKEE